MHVKTITENPTMALSIKISLSLLLHSIPSMILPSHSLISSSFILSPFTLSLPARSHLC